MAFRIKETKTVTTNTEGYGATGGSTVTQTPGKQTTTQKPAEDVTVTRDDRGFTVSFRMKVNGICGC